MMQYGERGCRGGEETGGVKKKRDRGGLQSNKLWLFVWTKGGGFNVETR